MLIKRIATVLLFCFLGALSGWGQSGDTPEERYLRKDIAPHRIDRGQWSALTKDIDYTEKKGREKPYTPDRNEPAPSQSRSIFGEGAGAAFARFLLITLGAIAIALLVRSILGYGRVKDKKISRPKEEKIDIQKIEENIHEADLVDFIGQAKAQGNYNLAIRLYYLAILKELSLQKTIKWKVDKTNNEYLREMRAHDHFAEFRELTRIFERSWYGDRPLDITNFQQLEPGYKVFLDQLTTSKTTLAS
jgi:hypothetical protein